MKHISIFASGSGSNAQNLIEYFRGAETATVVAVFCNNPKAGVIERCKSLGVPCIIFNRQDFYETHRVLELLEAFETDLVVLAGFLWLVPESLIMAYPDTIINIHPALLPNYGGKGMYGAKVHEAVINAGEKQSGITIHLVNTKYDEGRILSQHTVDIMTGDTPDTLAQKVHVLEYEYFPKIVEDYLLITDKPLTDNPS